eukprot:755281-Hanusia_phi.AAC.2
MIPGPPWPPHPTPRNRNCPAATATVKAASNTVTPGLCNVCTAPYLRPMSQGRVLDSSLTMPGYWRLDSDQMESGDHMGGHSDGSRRLQSYRAVMKQEEQSGMLGMDKTGSHLL